MKGCFFSSSSSLSSLFCSACAGCTGGVTGACGGILLGAFGASTLLSMFNISSSLYLWKHSRQKAYPLVFAPQATHWEKPSVGSCVYRTFSEGAQKAQRSPVLWYFPHYSHCSISPALSISACSAHNPSLRAFPYQTRVGFPQIGQFAGFMLSFSFVPFT